MKSNTPCILDIIRPYHSLYWNHLNGCEVCEQRFTHSQVSEKAAEPGAQEPDDAPKEAHAVSWISVLGLLGCAIVVDYIFGSYRVPM